LNSVDLADAVAPDEPDLGADRQRHRRAVEELPAPAVEHEIVDLEHEVTARSGVNGARYL
jgi:hypothetical protein